jgi:hypothetical protein
VQVKHIEHIDDYVFDGGAIQAIDTLYACIDALTGGNEKHLSISTKYDGAPAIVFGINPENGKFFTGTKSVFNKLRPIIIYNDTDIDLHYSDKPDLAEKMHAVHESLLFNYHSGLIPSGVYQGDLMFIRDDVAFTGNLIHFTPNTITYALNNEHEWIDNINNANIGIALHTSYVGDTLKDMRSFGTINYNDFYQMHSIWWLNPTVDLDMCPMHETNYSVCRTVLDRCEDVAKSISYSTTINRHSKALKQFINYCVRIGENAPNINMYRVFLKAKGFANLLPDHDDDHIQKAMNLRVYLDYVKRIIIEALEYQSPFYHEINGNPVSGEGYVIKYHGVMSKFVNRMEFSRFNFMNKKFTNA